eukprot:jgi/Mesvir1/3550/Mv12016-RA.1
MILELRAYCANPDVGVGILDLVPETFLLVPGAASASASGAASADISAALEEEARFRTSFAARAAAGRDNVWIAKPTDGQHGKGIQVMDDLEAILAYVNQQAATSSTSNALEDASSAAEPAGAGPGRISDASGASAGGAGPGRGSRPASALVRSKRQVAGAWLLQEYITRPLLLHGRKFDIRSYALVDHAYNVFWYKDWIIRTCSEPFVRGDYGNRIRHISNHCVQVHAANFSAHEEDNELFCEDLKRYLMEIYGAEQGAVLHTKIVDGMKRVVTHTVLSIKQSVLGNEFSSFQLYGYDFMVDEEFRVWLLEINGSPAAAQRMIPKLASDLVQVAIDRVFHPPAPARVLTGDACAYAGEEYVSEDNLFERVA